MSAESPGARAVRLRIAVLGPGGVGGLLAALLDRAAIPVTVIAREPTAQVLDESGIAVESVLFGDFVAHPAVATELREPVDALIVATKATGLDAALDRVEQAAIADAVVVPLLNGFEHLPRMRARLGPGVAAATIRVESDRPETGRIVHTSRFCRVELAGGAGIEAARLEAVAAALGDAGVKASVGASEPTVMWSKLSRLCPLALTTSASGEPIGFVRSDEAWRPRLEAAIAETAAVGRAEGAELDPGATLGELEKAHESLGSSLLRDIEAERPTELDAIGGAVVRAGKRHGVEVPTVEALVAEVRDRIGG